MLLNLKCDPQEALSLRGTFSCIVAAGHINKVHWNTITIDGSVAQAKLVTMVDSSYQLVVEALPKKIRALME